MTTVSAELLRTELAPQTSESGIGLETERGAALAAPKGAGLGDQVSRKLLTLIVVFCVMIAAVGSVGIYGLHQLNLNLTEITDFSVNRLRLAGQIQQEILAVVRAERNMIISDDPAEIDRIYSQLVAEVDLLKLRVDELRDLLNAPDQARLSDLDSVLGQWFVVNGRVRALSHEGADTDAFQLAAGEGRRLADRIGDLARNIALGTQREIASERLTSQGGYQTTRAFLIAAMLLALGFAAAFGTRIFVDIGKVVRLRRKAENELRATNGLLELRSSELRRTNGELEQFAYVASHDLKAPLRAIDNLAAWIAEDLGTALEGETERNMTLLRGRVHRLELLLDDLLKFSRAGRMEEDAEDVDLCELLEEIVGLVGVPQGFAVHWPADLPRLRTARTPLEQVLANLIGNAIKHHNRSTGRIDVVVTDRGSVYEFTVADDGPGIPSQFQERVFQLFQSLKPRDEVEGSGMGLAIVKKLIETQGGTITIESKDGRRGTTFRFGWPKVWLNPVQGND